MSIANCSFANGDVYREPVTRDNAVSLAAADLGNDRREIQLFVRRKKSHCDRMKGNYCEEKRLLTTRISLQFRVKSQIYRTTRGVAALLQSFLRAESAIPFRENGATSSVLAIANLSEYRLVTVNLLSLSRVAKSKLQSSLSHTSTHRLLADH